MGVRGLSVTHISSLQALLGDPHQKLDFLDAEGVGASEMVGQAPWCGDDHVGFAGQLQGLGHHVCRWEESG